MFRRLRNIGLSTVGLGLFFACANGGDGTANPPDASGKLDSGSAGNAQGGTTGSVDSSWPESDAGGKGGASGGQAGSGAMAGAEGGMGGSAGEPGAAGTGGIGPCGPESCMVDGNCVEAGLPNPVNPCEACLPVISGHGWSKDNANVTCKDQPYWTGVQRKLPRTPYNHQNAVSCHNCYASTLAATLNKIHAAQVAGADLIELDIKDQGGVIYVEHDDTGGSSYPRFSEVLADNQLKSGDQVLFIEIKENTPTEAFIHGVLDQLRAEGFGTAGRPIVLRTFDGIRQNLLLARKLLATPTYASMREHVRLHVLYSGGEGSNIAALQTKVADCKKSGLHGVEFEYRTPNLFGALYYAKSLGLGTSVWTIPVSMGEAYITAFRDEIDATTVDYPLAQARAVIEDKNALIYLNVAAQSATASKMNWYGSSQQAVHQAPVNVAGAPTTESLGPGEDRFGTSLIFESSKSQMVTFYDTKIASNVGYLVAMVVNFDTLSLAPGETQSLIGKANSGEFALELFNSAENSGTILRFGVFADGAYRYATYPASKLNGTDSYFIIGAYDGNGAVRLWVNNSETGATAAGPYTAGVVPNTVPVLLGADPQEGPARFFLDAKVQMVLVQEWKDH